MANQNFVVHNGLTVGQTTIDALTSNVAIPVGKQITVGNIILRDNGDGKLHARDVTDNSDAIIVATISAPSVTQGNIQIGTNHIESVNTDGPISLRPNGAGPLVFASNLVSAGKGYSSFEIATGLPMAEQYGVTYANANILLSPGRIGLYSGNVRVTQTTAATSIATGAFQVMGGAAIVGALHTGSYINTTGNLIAATVEVGSVEAAGVIYANGTVASTSTSTGALIVAGGISAGLNSFFGANVTIQGNLFVNGNTSVFNTNNLSINDALIYLADDNPADILDIGIVSSFTSGAGYQHTGFARDASDGIWKLFAGVTTEPTTTIDFTGATYSTLQVGNITTSGSGWANIGSINAAGNILGKTATLGSTTHNGTTTLNGTTTAQIVQPDGDNTRTLGASGARWSTVYGVTFSGTSTTANYADVAEKYTSDQSYEPGTVLQFGGSAEVTLAEEGTRKVAGVVSTNPAYLMNDLLVGENTVALALTGRVPVKVTGYIQKGDMLVSAGGGRARASAMPQIGTVIGKSLEDFDGSDGVIEVVVGRL